MIWPWSGYTGWDSRGSMPPAQAPAVLMTVPACQQRSAERTPPPGRPPTPVRSHAPPPGGARRAARQPAARWPCTGARRGSGARPPHRAGDVVRERRFALAGRARVEPPLRHRRVRGAGLFVEQRLLRASARNQQRALAAVAETGSRSARPAPPRADRRSCREAVVACRNQGSRGGEERGPIMPAEGPGRPGARRAPWSSSPIFSPSPLRK